MFMSFQVHNLVIPPQVNSYQFIQQLVVQALVQLFLLKVQVAQHSMITFPYLLLQPLALASQLTVVINQHLVPLTQESLLQVLEHSVSQYKSMASKHLNQVTELLVDRYWEVGHWVPQLMVAISMQLEVLYQLKVYQVLVLMVFQLLLLVPQVLPQKVVQMSHLLVWKDLKYQDHLVMVSLDLQFNCQSFRHIY